MEVSTALEMMKPSGFNQVGEIPVEKLVFEDSVRKMCEANSCGRYGKTWMCPPGIGPVEVWKSKVTARKHAILFNYIGKLEDSFDFEGMQAAGAEFAKLVRELKDKLDSAKADYILFGAGSCSICENCSYPDSPCRFPAKTIPSMESCGMFVSKIAVPCGFKYINGQNTVTYFGLLML